MIDAGAGDGEAEGGVDGGVEGEGFDRDVALVVVHADEGVGGFAFPGKEGGVGRERAFDGEALRAAGLNRGDNEAFFFAVAEEAVLAGVGIEAADDNFGFAAAELLERGRGELDDVEDAVFRKQSGDFVIADVDSDEGAGDFFGVLHHARAGGAGAGGEDFGVAGEIDAGGVHRFFV